MGERALEYGKKVHNEIERLLTRWTEGEYVLFDPLKRKHGELRWVRVVKVRQRYGVVSLGHMNVDFEVMTGAVDTPFAKRIGYVYASPEEFREARARDALIRTAACKLAREGAVNELSNELLREICKEMGVRSVPFHADVPERPEDND